MAVKLSALHGGRPLPPRNLLDAHLRRERIFSTLKMEEKSSSETLAALHKDGILYEIINCSYATLAGRIVCPQPFSPLPPLGL
jgi:hypothetical protein